MGKAGSLVMRRGDLVYWVRRRDDAPFLSGFHAFPGGLLESGDGGSFEAAALRETFEETGVDLRDQASRLRPCGVAIAPPYLVIQLETRFFELETDAEPHVASDNPELASGEWIRPADALARFDAGEVLLAPPTRAILRSLATGAPFDFEHDHSPIRPHIALFPVRTPTLPPATHTNVYVVGETRLAVFDPASPYPEERARLDAYLDARIEAGATVECLVLTHHHLDHVSGAAHLAARLGVPIAAHPETSSRVEFPVERALEHGDTIDLGEHALRVVHTPGHAPGHLCFVDAATGSAVVGDMVAGVGSILVEPGDGDMGEYIASLEFMRTQGWSCLMPSHGPVVGGATAKLTEYIEHRLDRERQAVEALRVGPADIATLVDRVYTDVPAAMKVGPTGGLAGVSLRAHLDKLLTDGRATLHGETWTLTSSVG